MNRCKGLWEGVIISLLLGVCFGIASAKTSQDMLLIPAGEFMMGSEDRDRDRDKDESPAHRVYLDAFYIDKYEVTNTQYRRFIKATGYRKPYAWEDDNFNRNNQPVVGVSWGDANEYCKWAGKRLPTEAQWEKASRGTDGHRFPWGQGWKRHNANSSSSDKNKTVPVGSYPQGVGPYGVHDMAGNVWEWCADWYGANYYLLSPTRNPTGPPIGEARVIRGGGWFDSPAQLRSANRFYSHPMVRYNSIGFRCAKDDK